MFKKIIAVLLVSALCLPIGAMTVSAESERSAAPSDTATDAIILDDGTAMTMALAKIETADTGDIYVYEVEYDGVLDHTIEVDVENDAATITYADGNIETLVISEHVRVTKIPEIKTPTVRSVNAELLVPPYTASHSSENSRNSSNYIYQEEPFEIDATGEQEYLGTYVYYNGFEYVGSASFTNPTQSAYLIRKPMGYEEFDDYYYEIDVGTAVEVAVAIIQGLLDFDGDNIYQVLLNLALDLWSINSNDEVSLFTAGVFSCREYRWDYRVCRDPYEPTLLTVTKYRYWWCMTKDGSDLITYQKRNDLVEGCQYSNIDIVAAGLGRIVIYA